ncbi:MAG: primosomal replication protein N [Burkholderiaceae bacterium]|nr:primosomal replication protein N [Burkholderiaceae bacterium]
MNQIRIHAKVIGKSALRFTPAGIAVLEADCLHEGTVIESGLERALAFEFSTVALAAVAQALDREALGIRLKLTGFIAPRTRRSARLVMHVTEFEIFNEIDDGV